MFLARAYFSCNGEYLRFSETAYLILLKPMFEEIEDVLYSCEAQVFTERGYFIVGKPIFLAREHIL
jgi:hypothetical protein